MTDGDPVRPKEAWTTPYARAGGARPIPGPALAAVARDVLTRGHAFRFHAPGASMYPFIRDGDVVTLVPFRPLACIPGDVVAFVDPRSGRLVVHRVVWISDDGCRIRGDNNPQEDGEFPFEAVIGTVSRVERNGRPVRAALGPERTVIALLSRQGALSGCITAARAARAALGRRS